MNNRNPIIPPRGTADKYDVIAGKTFQSLKGGFSTQTGTIAESRGTDVTISRKDTQGTTITFEISGDRVIDETTNLKATDENLLPENILKDIEIMGVKGMAEHIPSEYKHIADDELSQVSFSAVSPVFTCTIPKSLIGFVPDLIVVYLADHSAIKVYNPDVGLLYETPGYICFLGDVFNFEYPRKPIDVQSDMVYQGDPKIEETDGDITVTLTMSAIVPTVIQDFTNFGITDIICFKISSGGGGTGGNAQPGDVVKDKTFTNDSGEQTGTLPDSRGADSLPQSTSVIANVLKVVPRWGVYDTTSSIDVADANFAPYNIREGTSLFGMTGTAIIGRSYIRISNTAVKVGTDILRVTIPKSEQTFEPMYVLITSNTTVKVKHKTQNISASVIMEKAFTPLTTSGGSYTVAVNGGAWDSSGIENSSVVRLETKLYTDTTNYILDIHCANHADWNIVSFAPPVSLSLLFVKF